MSKPKKEEKDLKLNIIGLISAIIAFITIVLPWYTESVGTTTFNNSLLDFVNITLSAGIPGTAWLLLIALVFVVVGGLLGLFGSFIVGKNGKNLLKVGMVLIILSPIAFAARVVDVGYPLFGTVDSSYLSLSFGFFLTIVAAILMLISATKHPMEAGAAPSAPIAPPPPPPQ